MKGFEVVIHLLLAALMQQTKMLLQEFISSPFMVSCCICNPVKVPSKVM